MQRLWRARGTGRWPTTDGRTMEVHYPGRWQGCAGPDFQGALLARGPGPPLRGGVEAHVRSSDWEAHGHHRDPRYNQVGLQVVVWPDAQESCHTGDGGEVPLVALGPEMGKGPLGQLSLSEPCRGAGWRRGWASLGGTLEAAGLERLRRRAGAYKLALSRSSADQALYEGIMEALGYSQNQGPFLKLAQGLPISRLKELRDALPLPAGGRDALPYLYECLVVAAGLGPPSQQGDGAILSAKDWTTAAVRPANHPQQRLKAAAVLLARFLHPGLSVGLLPYLERGLASLEEALVVPGERGQPSPLGRDRARELIINGVLPFFYAWGEATGSPAVTRAALGLYAACPPHGADWVVRSVTAQLWGRVVALPRACHQQGCHQVFQQWCRSRSCGGCPLAP